MRSLHALFFTSIALLALAVPAPATASPPFPEAIKADLSLTYTLGTSACLMSPTSDCHCTICHMSNSGGVGTVVHPFGMSMKMAGLMLENTDSLKTALMTLDANKTDSDCDGVPDIEQLKAGRDPNTGVFIDGSGMPAPANDVGCTNAGPTVAYGCGAQLARTPASWPGAAALVGLALAFRLRLARRLRRR
jgi:MYXO-CTERM domain-containing protein